MTRTIDEYRERKPLPAREGPQRTDLKMLAQETVRLAALTGDEHWDHFLSYLEAAVKIAKHLSDGEAAKLRDPMLVNAEEIAKCRARITQLDSRIVTLEEILLLPKFLRENAAAAREKIAEMEREAAQA